MARSRRTRRSRKAALDQPPARRSGPSDRARLAARRTDPGLYRGPHQEGRGLHRRRPERALLAAGALGEPERLLTRHDRRRDRRPGMRGRHRAQERRRGLGRPLRADGRRLAGAREGLDRHHQRPVLGPAVLPAADQGRKAKRARPTTSATAGRRSTSARSSIRATWSWWAGREARGDPAILNTVQVVDQQLASGDPSGRFFWHRFNFDGYGEQKDGSPWDFGFPQNGTEVWANNVTIGRNWPIFGGERGEYELFTGNSGPRARASPTWRGRRTTATCFPSKCGRRTSRQRASPASGSAREPPRPRRWRGRTPSSCAWPGRLTPAARSRARRSSLRATQAARAGGSRPHRFASGSAA